MVLPDNRTKPGAEVLEIRIERRRIDVVSHGSGRRRVSGDPLMAECAGGQRFGVAKQPEREVEVVDRPVRENAAAVRSTRPVCSRRQSVGRPAPRSHGVDATEDAVCNSVSQVPGLVPGSVFEADAQQSIVRFRRGVDHVPGLARIQRHGLLAQDVTSRLQGTSPRGCDDSRAAWRCSRHRAWSCRASLPRPEIRRLQTAFRPATPVRAPDRIRPPANRPRHLLPPGRPADVVRLRSGRTRSRRLLLDRPVFRSQDSMPAVRIISSHRTA